ncbi:MAG: glutaredoxin family protein [Burkholderiaceae bacterium]
MKTMLKLLCCAPLLLVGLPSHAQYKVTGPDGKVTYTDRPPVSADGKVSSINARGGASEVSLPLDLRRAVSRYPVTLFVASAACEPCDAGRQLLRQRGIPFNERQVQTPEDNDALERLSGGRDAPTLSIGSQILRGLSPETWASYLDAAGYPRESQLPPNYQYPAAAPVVARTPPPRAPEPASTQAPAAAPAANPSGIKF